MKTIEKILSNKQNNFEEEIAKNNEILEFLKKELYLKIKKESFIVYNKTLFLDISPVLKTIYTGKKKTFNNLIKEKFDLTKVVFN